MYFILNVQSCNSEYVFFIISWSLYHTICPGMAQLLLESHRTRSIFDFTKRNSSCVRCRSECDAIHTTFSSKILPNSMPSAKGFFSNCSMNFCTLICSVQHTLPAQSSGKGRSQNTRIIALLPSSFRIYIINRLLTRHKLLPDAQARIKFGPAAQFRKRLSVQPTLSAPPAAAVVGPQISGEAKHRRESIQIGRRNRRKAQMRRA